MKIRQKSEVYSTLNTRILPGEALLQTRVLRASHYQGMAHNLESLEKNGISVVWVRSQREEWHLIKPSTVISYIRSVSYKVSSQLLTLYTELFGVVGFLRYSLPFNFS